MNEGGTITLVTTNGEEHVYELTPEQMVLLKRDLVPGAEAGPILKGILEGQQPIEIRRMH